MADNEGTTGAAPTRRRAATTAATAVPAPAAARQAPARKARGSAGSPAPAPKRASGGKARARGKAAPTAAAFFDLDRTLLRGGSGPVFARTLRGLGVATPSVPGQDLLFRLYDLVGESKLLMTLARGAVSRAAGLDRDHVRAAAEAAADELLAMVPPYVPGVLERHRDDGLSLVLATSSPFDLVEPFARRLGLDAVIATRYVESDGRYTGEVDGDFVWGDGKLRAVQEHAARHGLDLAASYAYSDSVFDVPMLSAVGHPVAVNPDVRLAAVAAVRRWPVRWFDAPPGVPSIAGVEPLDVARVLLRAELLPFVRFAFDGIEHLPRTGGVIIAANHRSYFDPLTLAITLAKAGRNGRFLAKKEVVDAPLIGQLTRALGTIRVDRGTGSDQPLLEAASAVRAGEAVVILPQGTIPRGEALHDPHLRGRPGVARLAAITGAPVVPIGVWGTELVWPRSDKVPRVWNVASPPTVTVRVGPPLELGRGRATAADDTDTVMRAIESLLPQQRAAAR